MKILLSLLLLTSVQPVWAIDWPEPVVNTDADPYRHVGLITTGSGTGSGFVAGDSRIVFTAAHVLTNESGDPIPSVFTSYHPGYNLPGPPDRAYGRAIRGVVLYTGEGGYANLLETYGAESTKGLEQDIAVAWGYQPMADEGALPFLDDGSRHLATTIRKKLVGYPTGLYLGQVRSEADPDRYRMHETGIGIGSFARMEDTDDRVMVVVAASADDTVFVSAPGNSGGPILVETSPGIWGAAGIVVAGISDVELTPDRTENPVYGGRAVIRTLHRSDWSALAEPTLPKVAGPPVFTQQPTDRLIYPLHSGGFVTRVTARGDSEITYQWYKDGGLLAGATWSKLIFNSANPRQSGVYELVATNEYGSTRSNPATLTVPPGPGILEQPIDLGIPYGGVAIIEFEYYAVPPYHVIFYRDGIALPEFLAKGYYKINQPGDYYAIVTSEHGEVQTETITAKIVLDQSFFSRHPRDYSVASVGKGCLFSASPTYKGATLQWYNDGVAIPGQTRDTLRFEVQGLEDEGLYHVVATTPMGTIASDRAELTVGSGRPGLPYSMTSFPDPIPTRLGGTAHLSVNAAGSGPMSYQWNFEGKPLPGRTRSAFEISPVRAGNLGSYSVTVSNRSGSYEFKNFKLEDGLSAFWTQMPFPSLRPIQAVAGNADCLVVVTKVGEILRTVDGRNWGVVARYSGTRPKAVAAGPNRIVVVGDGIAAVSLDGRNWDASSIPHDFSVIACGEDFFIASDKEAGLFTSTDGLSWKPTPIVTGKYSPGWSMTWGEQGFVATNGELLATSPDGLNWQTRTWQRLPTQKPAYRDSITELLYSKGQYWALHNGTRIISSTDGISWSIVHQVITGKGWMRRLFALDGTLLVASSKGIMAVNRDGSAWDEVDIPWLDDEIASIAWKNRIVHFSDKGTGLISAALDQPIVPIDMTPPQTVLPGQPVDLSIGILPGPDVVIQWYVGESGDTSQPVDDGNSTVLSRNWDQAGSYWARIIAEDESWDSPTIEVTSLSPGAFFARDGDVVAAAFLGDCGKLDLITFDLDERRFTSMANAKIVDGGRFHGTANQYFANAERIGWFSHLETGGEFADGDLVTNSEIGRITLTATGRPSPGDHLTEQLEGIYRFAPTGLPYSEGMAIVAVNGEVTALIHTSEHVLAGTGRLDLEGRLVISDGPHGRFSINLDPLRQTLTGQLSIGNKTWPVAGLKRGTENASGFSNLSTRSMVRGGEGVTIAGFVTDGPSVSPMLIRGVGPGLRDFGITGNLADPEVEVSSSGQILGSNDNWEDVQDLVALEAATRTAGAFSLNPGSLDAAVIVEGSDGLMTATVVGKGGDQGTVLTEAYLLGESGSDQSTDGDLLNLSVRGHVAPGDRALVAGFIITGDRPRQVLIRAIGLSLGDFGISDPLEDGLLTLHHRDQTLANSHAIRRDVLSPMRHTMLSKVERSVGAFVTDLAEPAFMVWLNPGAYSAVVSTEKESGGIALIEIYLLPFDAPTN